MIMSIETFVRQRSSFFSWTVLKLMLILIVFGYDTTTADAAPIQEKTALSDDGITKTIEDELLFARGVVPNDIHVVTLKGVVTLTGRSPTLLEKDRAVNIAKTIKGVRSIVNQIAVDPLWARSDKQLQSDAKMALTHDLATDSWETDVDVNHHVATLTGEVDSWREKALAETVVKGVKGIRSIKNNIEIKAKPDFRDDFEIQAEVQEAIEWDALLNDQLINVAVKGGEVQLTGTVGSAAEKKQAYSDAWVAGVADVDDSKLDVTPLVRDSKVREIATTVRSDEDIEKALMDAMVQDSRVSSFDIYADAKHGTVALSGTVDNLNAKRAAERDAWNTIGVCSVENHILFQLLSPTDDEIARRIHRIFGADPYVEPFDIVVAVKSGTARLSGDVNSDFERTRAYELAAGMFGINKVENDIKIKEQIQPLDIRAFVHPYN